MAISLFKNLNLAAHVPKIRRASHCLPKENGRFDHSVLSTVLSFHRWKILSPVRRTEPSSFMLAHPVHRTDRKPQYGRIARLSSASRPRWYSEERGLKYSWDSPTLLRISEVCAKFFSVTECFLGNFMKVSIVSQNWTDQRPTVLIWPTCVWYCAWWISSSKSNRLDFCQFITLQ